MAAEFIKVVKKSPLRRGDMDPDPIKQLARWFQDAGRVDIPLPNAMTLATSNRHGKPSARIVLLKGFDERGFVFHSNSESRKGHDLRENPFAALVFCWLPLSRQVRVEGPVEPLGAGESDLYFADRPSGHQIETDASQQGQIIKDRSFLAQPFEYMARKFEGQAVPTGFFRRRASSRMCAGPTSQQPPTIVVPWRIQPSTKSA